MLTVTIGIENTNDKFKVPISEDTTLEQFKNALETTLGYKCNLNILTYDIKKNQKVKDLFKNDFEIFAIKDEKFGNTCCRDALIQSVVHSMAEKLVKKEDISKK